MRACSAVPRPAPVRSLTALALTASLLPVTALLATPAHAVDALTQQSVVRVSAPSTATAGSRVRVYARLLADDKPVQNGVVDLQRWNGTGWAKVGQIATNAEGLGSTTYALTSSSRFRASYPGNSYRTPAESSAVDVRATASLGQRAITEAKRHYRKPYRYGATGPSYFDCSGFTGYVFRTLGKSLPRTSGQQAQGTRRVANSAKQVGDLIFTWNGGRVTHVGIYAGNNTMWAATKTGDVVRPQSLYSRTYTVGRV